MLPLLELHLQYLVMLIYQLLPIGGVILSVGSTEGHGYQPLVAAGGTAVVSTAGTIQSVSIGYSGSGYRSGIGQTVNVGVGTTSLTTPNTQWILLQLDLMVL